MRKFLNKLERMKNITVSENVEVINSMRIKTVFRLKVEIYDLSNLKTIMLLMKKYKIKYYILGEASNVLFVNSYYEAVLLKIYVKFTGIDKISAFEKISVINNRYKNMGIDSLTFLTMVPGSVGGAIYMNAGAFSKEIKDVIEYVYFYDIKAKKFKVFTNEECKFSYRNSYFKNHKVIILGAKIKLIYSNVREIKENCKSIISARKEKFPYDKPNLGSVFKNFDDISAGKIIDLCSLKGSCVNGAMVSYKHANVIVNNGNATGRDVMDLINIIKKTVYKRYGRVLELEIITFE